jgi:uncharacterized protein YndB with AHSA1/START domain
MVKDLVVTRSIELNASVERVWEALTHPGMTKHYMFGCAVQSEWKKGDTIAWHGHYNGSEIFQHGEIMEIVPCKLLRYSTFDPRGDDPDLPENYVYISYELKPIGPQRTRLLTTLENFGGDEVRAENAAQIWDTEVLPRLKAFVETTL